MLSLEDILTILEDIRLHFKEEKKKHQRALSSQNLKTKHKTYNCSTTIVSLGAIWVPKEAKFFRKINFFGLVRCFLVKIDQKQPFLCGFSKFVQFWLKISATNPKNWLP